MKLNAQIAKAIYESRNGRGCKPWGRLPLSHQESYLEDAAAALAVIAEHGGVSEIMASLVSENDALREALTMVRDADNDCHADGLPTIPDVARWKIDRALAQ